MTSPKRIASRWWERLAPWVAMAAVLGVVAGFAIAMPAAAQDDAETEENGDAPPQKTRKAVTMREKVTAIREWGRTRARPAAEPERTGERTPRKVRLEPA